MNKRAPTFHPVENMPLLETGINGIVESSEEQFSSLMLAKDKPHVLDDATVNRIIKAFTEQKEHFVYFEQQFSRWEKEKLTTSQAGTLKNMLKSLNKAKDLNYKVLAIVEQLKSSTIESVLEKDDLTLLQELLKKNTE